MKPSKKLEKQVVKAMAQEIKDEIDQMILTDIMETRFPHGIAMKGKKVAIWKPGYPDTRGWFDAKGNRVKVDDSWIDADPRNLVRLRKQKLLRIRLKI